jgi:nifR3 family TIM-barrel protein
VGSTLRIGPLSATTPVVLAPMAGITNQAFRALCRRFGPGGIYVSEMVTSRALVERNAESMRLIRFDPDEWPRSVQVYGVEPATVAAAVSLLVDEDRADHIDLNFGCPVAKVTRKGGGAALPWKQTLLRKVIRAAVRAAAPVPVTVKMRMGIDAEHLTYLEAGLTAEEEGVAAVALHARTAEQYYGGRADWPAIARLTQTLKVPVLGNGDLWSATDALAMVAETGCAGVVVGRGCLGRPWLFADLAAAFSGGRARVTPSLTEVGRVIVEHADLLIAHFGEQPRALRDLRKHMAWYLKGYPVGSALRRELAMVSSRDELTDLLAGISDAPYPGSAAEGSRGRTVGAKRVALPQGWLDSRELTGVGLAMVRQAELSVSGG